MTMKDGDQSASIPVPKSPIELALDQAQRVATKAQQDLHEARAKLLEGQKLVEANKQELAKLRSQAAEFAVTKTSLERQLEQAQTRVEQLSKMEDAGFLSQFHELAVTLAELTAPWAKTPAPGSVFVPPGEPIPGQKS